MKKSIVLIVLISFICFGLKKQKEYGSVLVDEIVRVYDGDTFYCNVNQWPPILGENIGVRIYGIDTPEIRGSSPEIKEYAYKAKSVVLEKLKNSKCVILKNIKRGKYFRVVADVECDGKDLASILINKGLAKPYYGQTKDQWDVNDINDL